VRKIFAVLILLSFFLINACTPRYLTPKLYREATLEDLIGFVQGRDEKIKTVSASLRMGFKDLEKEDSRHCLGVFLFEKPDRFRIRAYPQLGPTLFEITSDGESLWIYIPKEGKVYSTRLYPPSANGPVRNPKRPAAKFDFDFRDLRSTFFVSELLGMPGITKYLEKKEKEYILYLTKNGRLLEKIWIERSAFLVTRIEKFGQDDSLDLEVSFEKYHRVDDIDFPLEVRISKPQEGQILTFFIQRVKLNDPMKPGVFQFKAPPGIEVVELDRQE
jgi:outer membrane lipoprotein-sorting protein